MARERLTTQEMVEKYLINSCSSLNLLFVRKRMNLYLVLFKSIVRHVMIFTKHQEHSLGVQL